MPVLTGSLYVATMVDNDVMGCPGDAGLLKLVVGRQAELMYVAADVPSSRTQSHYQLTTYSYSLQLDRRHRQLNLDHSAAEDLTRRAQI